MMINEQITVQLTTELRALLRRRAQAEDRSVAYIVRQAVAEMARREDKAARR